MSIKIVVQKEVTVDLNAYYPNFTRNLRAAIDEAIMATLSGNKEKPFWVKPTRPDSHAKSWAKENDGFPLTHPQRKFRIGKPPARGKLRGLYATLNERFISNNEDMPIGDIKHILEGQGVPKTQLSTTISNLWRCGALQINRLN